MEALIKTCILTAYLGFIYQQLKWFLVEKWNYNIILCKILFQLRIRIAATVLIQFIFAVVPGCLNVEINQYGNCVMKETFAKDLNSLIALSQKSELIGSPA